MKGKTIASIVTFFGVATFVVWSIKSHITTASFPFPPPLSAENVRGIWEGHVIGKRAVAILELSSTNNSVLILANADGTFRYDSSGTIAIDNHYLDLNLIREDGLFAAHVVAGREVFNHEDHMRAEITEISKNGGEFTETFILYHRTSDRQNYFDTMNHLVMVSQHLLADSRRSNP